MTGFWQRHHAVRSIGLVCLALPVALIATPAAAQVTAVTNGGLNLDGQNTACTDPDGTLYIVNGQDCDPGGVLTGADPYQFHFVRGFRFGSGQTATYIESDGTATFGGLSTFNGGAIFNGGVQFNGQVNFAGFTTMTQLNSGNIINSGALTTNSMNANSISVTGKGTFGGALSSGSFSTGDAQVSKLLVGEETTIGGKLTINAGTQINAGGNRIQNVGAPVDGTDAANKNYVDTALSGVQGDVTNLTNTVAGQDTRITAVEGVNTVQDTRLTNVETENGVQNTRLTTIETVNTGQDSRLTAIESVNTTQSNQISTLQGQVGNLQTAVTGLKRNIQEANAGIAASVALGGTMIVPDSKVSVSFNLATYRGEQGFSGSLVGRLSPRIYVNAGVGASTVKGSTTGRVGISFGL